jgi:hypothetical protein
MSFFEQSNNQTLQESFIGCLICTIYLDDEATDQEIDDMVASFVGRSLFNGYDSNLALRKQILRRSLDDHNDILKECCAGITDEWKATVFSVCADLVFKDRIITDAERTFLKKMKDYLQLPEDVTNKILDVLLIMYKGKI